MGVPEPEVPPPLVVAGTQPRNGPSVARKLAILDDYQSFAAGFAPWHELQDLGIEATVFTEHLGGEVAVVDRLRGFEILVAMRERTHFRGMCWSACPAFGCWSPR